MLPNTPVADKSPPRIEAVDVVRAVCRHAERFQEIGGEEHHVASPFGAWLLLALIAPAAQGAHRDQLRTILGVDPDAAGAFAARLLQHPHKGVASAVACWTASNLEAESLAAFLAALPVGIERGGRIPSTEELDAWAREHTLGLIPAFPVFTRTPEPSLLLASALATKVTWRTPFHLTSAADLGKRSEWSRRLSQVLESPSDTAHRQFIAPTARAGNVAVHTAFASGDVFVTSVIADPGVASADVLAAAHEIATKLARGEQGQHSLFALPLGSTRLWTITEREVATSDATDGEQRESYTTIIPSWRAQSSHDLSGATLGFEPAAAALAMMAGLPLERAETKQSAMARYTRVGFEAAALTMMSVRFGSSRSAPTGVVLERHAQLRFGHPFAVVAITQQHSLSAAAGSAEPWNGMPVFYAWVAEPMDAEDEPGDRQLGREEDAWNPDDWDDRDDRDDPLRESSSGRDRAQEPRTFASGIGGRLLELLRRLVLRLPR